MSGDYGYGQSIGFLRFCDDPELACCRAEKDYLRLKAQEIGLYEKAMELEYELTLLRKVVEAARGVFLGEGEHLCSEFENAMDRLRQALAELDEEPSHD